MYFLNRGSTIIVPIHKSGDIEEPMNYRQINYFQSYPKYWKSHLNWTNRELRKRKLLFKRQYAYRYNSSTDQALVNVAEQIYKYIDRR